MVHTGSRAAWLAKGLLLLVVVMVIAGIATAYLNAHYGSNQWSAGGGIFLLIVIARGWWRTRPRRVR